ncbi:MAG TPA: M48 family metalloprotease [Anaerovoracaceae bacterium]|nr:M48 family metalloprotease [Anaerovoracaceae bacterium]
MSKYVSTYERVNRSRRRSIAVVIGFIMFFGLIFGLIGLYFSQSSYYYDFYDVLYTVAMGAGLGVLISLIISLVTYKRSGKILAKAAGAREISRKENPHLYEAVHSIAAGAQIKPPKVYIIESGEMNAFASGSGGGNSMVAVTRGLLEVLNREELEGVIAHEVAHLKNDDIKFVSLAAALAASMLMILNIFGRSMFYSRRGGRVAVRNSRDSGGRGNAIVIVVAMLLSVIAIVIGPLIVRIMQSAVSKQREFLADASGATIIGYPLGLASALEKIDKHNRRYLEQNETAFINKSVHALCISQPLTKKVSRLFATHPPIEERVSRLKGM